MTSVIHHPSISLTETEFFGETDISAEEFQTLLDQFSKENGFEIKKLGHYFFIENYGEPVAVIKYFKGKVRLIENFLDLCIDSP